MILCFDLDRTLIDSDKPHVLSFNQAFEENGLKRVNEKKLIKSFGPISSIVLKTHFPKITKTKINKIVNRHKELLGKKYYKYAKPFPSTKKLLNKLKKDKHKIIITSNCKHQNIINLLKGTKIDRKYFSAIIGEDDVKKGKPSPYEIRKAERLMHHKIDFMIGDTIYDIKAGKAAKVKTIAVATGHQPRTKLKKERPDYLIKNLTELPRILKQYNLNQ